MDKAVVLTLEAALTTKCFFVTKIMRTIYRLVTPLGAHLVHDTLSAPVFQLAFSVVFPAVLDGLSDGSLGPGKLIGLDRNLQVPYVSTHNAVVTPSRLTSGYFAAFHPP
jgi:hypothetical protein